MRGATQESEILALPPSGWCVAAASHARAVRQDLRRPLACQCHGPRVCQHVVMGVITQTAKYVLAEHDAPITHLW